MVKFKLEIYINNIWTTINYVSSNISITNKRHDDYELVIRTTCEGDLSFKGCDNFNLLLPYLNTFSELVGRLTEYGCTGATVHNGYLALNEKADFANYVITGKFIVKDKYYNILDNPIFNINTEININNFNNVLNNRFLYANVNELNYISLYSLNLQNVILGLLNRIDSSLTFSDNFKNYKLVNNEDWVNAKDLSYILQKEFIINFKTIIDFFRDFLFYGFKIENNVFSFVKLKYNTSINGESLLTSETAKSQVCTFENSKPSTIKFQTFDFNVNEMQSLEKNFATTDLIFSNLAENKLVVSTNINTNPFFNQKNKISIFETANYSISDFNYNKFNTTFTNVNSLFYYLYGDFNELSIQSDSGNDLNNFSRYIESPFFYFYADSSSPQIESVTFDFEWASPNTYTTGDLKYIHINGVESDVKIGSNTMYFTSYFQGWYKIKFRLIPNKSIGYGNSFAKIKNLNIIVSHYRFANKIINVSGIPNYNLSINNQINSFAANMPKSQGTLKLSDGTESFVNNLHTKNDFSKEIHYHGEYKLIDDFDFTKLYETKQGWMRLNSVKKGLTSIDLQLSKKY